MTQEQKAKAYDNVREKIAVRFGSNVAKEIFSEYEESEDERIMKALINGFNKLDKSAVWYNGITNGQILAWLDKQGGNKQTIYPIFRVGDKIRHRSLNITATIINIKDGEYILSDSCGTHMPIEWQDNYKLEKQGEQNATELSNICEFSLKTWIKIVDFVLTEHNGIGNYLDSYETKDTAKKLREKYKFDAASEEWDKVYRKGLDAGANIGKALALKEQKSAWSEEDETVLNNLIYALANDRIGNDRDEYISWLKSLKDRVQPQPRQEWSEEDKVILDALIRKLEGEDIYISPHLAVKTLKSLRPQSHWKPSDEQMEALTDAMDKYCGMYKATLCSLYNNLKKLKQ